VGSEIILFLLLFVQIIEKKNSMGDSKQFTKNKNKAAIQQRYSEQFSCNNDGSSKT
jgi:hypothetical protein